TVSEKDFIDLNSGSITNNVIHKSYRRNQADKPFIPPTVNSILVACANINEDGEGQITSAKLHSPDIIEKENKNFEESYKQLLKRRSDVNISLKKRFKAKKSQDKQIDPAITEKIQASMSS